MMMFRLEFFLSVCWLLGWISFPAAAATDQAATEQVKARLIASVDAVHPGDNILLGVQQLIIPHWHTYWKNPGDSGLATQIDYGLPDGAIVGPIQWPTPERISLGPVVNYGYQHEVTLLTPVKLPDNLAVGSRLPIKATAKWLVCEEACIPQEVELELALPVVAPDSDAGPGSPLIEQALARLPSDSPWPVELIQQPDGVILRVLGNEFQASQPSAVWFYPDEWGRVSNGAQQPRRIFNDGISLQLKSGDAPLSPGQTLTGVLTISESNGTNTVTRGYTVRSILASNVSSQPETAESELAVPSAIVLALLGGVILNLMPCVFPVLSMKALALVSHAGHSSQRIRLHGWLYTAGVLTSFALLAAVLIGLKAGGSQVGWGFQFQSPLFVVGVAYLMFAVGLNLSGVFSIGGSIVGVGSSLARRSGYSGSFFTGVLATVVATPCTAPFMGAAIGFALTQPPVALLSVFLSLGLGLALPYLLLSYWPWLQRSLPKPGMWMDRLKQGLAFPMYGASAWLIWVLTQQAGANAVAVALAGIVAIGFACWLFEINKHSAVGARHVSSVFASLLLAAVLYGSYIGLEDSSSTQAAIQEQVTDSRHWEPFSTARLNALRSEGKPVFVNFTAAWCISCLVNERVALNQSEVKLALQSKSITYLKGDWTNRDAEITRFLAEFGRSGVPLYLYYPPGSWSKPAILPQILTAQIVTQAFTAADITANNSIR